MVSIEDLSRKQLEDIVSDLRACISTDRLRDSTYGWEIRLSKKGYSIPKPCTLPQTAPTWKSLKRAGLMDDDGNLR